MRSNALSALIAKQRLQWCVSGRRNGGDWIAVGWEVIQLRQADGRVIRTTGLPNRFRWRYA